MRVNRAEPASPVTAIEAEREAEQTGSRVKRDGTRDAPRNRRYAFGRYETAPARSHFTPYATAINHSREEKEPSSAKLGMRTVNARVAKKCLEWN